MVNYKIIFFTGLVIFAASFFLPVNDETYGYGLAYIVLTVDYVKDFPVSLWTGFLSGVTNFAAVVMIVSWFAPGPKKWISVLALVGSCAAIYWVQEIARHNYFWVTGPAFWAAGFLLMTAGYEMKRRQLGS